MATQRSRPFALIVLDGWGYRTETDANAIAQANKPFWDHLWNNYPHTLISGCGRCVGLPEDQMGNSEVGHLNMGAGRVVNQDLTRIDLDIETGDFFNNPVLVSAIQKAAHANKAIHIVGLVSDGGVHSHEKHFHALLDLASQYSATRLYLHAFLDGRDTPPQSAAKFLTALEKHCAKIKCGQIASLIGRYYAMDRDKRWERVEKAYALITEGKAEFHAKNALSGLEQAYARGETDEFVSATTIHSPNTSPIRVEDGDVIIFMNFRADRARELTQAFVCDNFQGFQRHYHPTLGDFVTLTEYDATIPTSIAYTPQKLTQILGEYLSEHGMTQLRLAETEKYAHVTFFFNGGIEEPFPGEERILIPSPRIATYDLQPEMSAYEVTDVFVNAINQNKYDVIICNFANPDMVGHTGNFPATVKAIETIDTCLQKIITALQSVGGEALITADHGNAEFMYDTNTGQPHTAHTHELVPLLYIGRPAHAVKTNGVLADVAPTLLSLLNLKQPTEMTGQPLFELE